MLTQRWHTREDSGLRLDRELRWWHDDERVEHPKIVEAFNQGLSVDEQGRYVLRLGRDWCFVQVEECGFEVRSLAPAGNSLLLSLSDRREEPLDPGTLFVGDDGVFRCRVKSGRALARFSRDAQAQLGERLEERDGGLMLKVGETNVPVLR